MRVKKLAGERAFANRERYASDQDNSIPPGLNVERTVMTGGELDCGLCDSEGNGSTLVKNLLPQQRFEIHQS
jgi:hypothetical protein